MKLAVMRNQLQRALARVARVVPNRPMFPELGAILLVAEANRLRLAATNLEVSVTCWLDCVAEETGAIAVPARPLVNFIGNLPEGEVNLLSAPGSTDLRLRAGQGAEPITATIHGLGVEDYPPVADMVEESPGDFLILLAPDELRDMIDRTSFAVGTDEERPVLAGIHLSVTADGCLTLVATDTRRLSVSSTDLPEATGRELSVVVPARALTELARGAAETQEPVTLMATANRNELRCQAGSVAVWSRLIDGAYPDWRTILPKRYDTRVVADRQRLLDLLKLASSFTSKAEDRVQLTVTLAAESSAGSLAVSADTAEVGDNTSLMGVAVEGPAVQRLFNTQYLVEALGVIGGEEVALEMQVGATTTVLRPIGDDNHVQLITPYHSSSTRN